MNGFRNRSDMFLTIIYLHVDFNNFPLNLKYPQLTRLPTSRDLRLFVILLTFFLLFYICLKPRLLCASHHKTTNSRTLTLFCKKILQSQTKTEKAPPSSWLILCLGRLMTRGNFAKFSNFFETQCWQPTLTVDH